MEGNWRHQSQGDSSSMDATSSVDWRSQLQPEARERIVNKIMETLKRHLPISVSEGLNELKKIAIRYEEKIYTAATSQSDYLRRFSMKMLSMETETEPSAPINPTNGGVNQNPPDSGSLGVQSQINNPGQPRQLIQQNLPSNTSAAVQGSSGLASALPSISGSAELNISSVTQASNLQNMPGISQTFVNDAIGQGSQTDMYANAQRQRLQQQQNISQQQQSQNPMTDQHHLQQRMLKMQLQQSSLLQLQMQLLQPSLLPSHQLQSTQPSLMQISSNLQSSQSNIQQSQAANTQLAPQPGFQQNQLNQIQQPVPSLLQQNSQSVPVQQQSPSLQQQSTPISQQSITSQQHQLMRQQENISNMQQNQLHRQQNSIGGIQQQQQQQQQRLPIQKNNLLSMQQQQQKIMSQQALSFRQKQQQQLGSQNNMSGLLQQQQLPGSHPSASILQSHQQAMLLQKLQQQLQQIQPSSLSLLQSQGHQSQRQSLQQLLMSQLLYTRMQQQSNSLQLQGPSSIFRAQNAMEQKPLIQTQRRLQEVTSSSKSLQASVDSTAQTGHADALDWREACYQKVLSMKELYYTDLNELHQKITMKLQQQEAFTPPGNQTVQREKLKCYKIMLERMLALLQISSKNIVPVGLKEKLAMYEEHIVNMVTSQGLKMIPPQAQGQQFQHLNVENAHAIPQEQPSQISQMQLSNNNANQVQQVNMQQGPGTSLQPSGASSLQHVSVPLSTAHQDISNALQPGSNMDSVQESSFNARQPGATGSGQQGVPVHDLATVSCRNRPNKRQPVPANGPRTDCESYSNAQGDSSTKKQKVSETKEPTFSCPICMHTIVSLWSTTCGHIFCEGCIKRAIQKQGKCPSCRTGLAMKNGIHRVFLPTAD